MDTNIHISRESFGAFNDQELLKVQNIIEEFKLKESVVSVEWEKYALSKKINDNFSKHLDSFKTVLKKNIKKLQEQSKQTFQDVVIDEEPTIFVGEDITFDDVLNDHEHNEMDKENEIPITNTSTTTTNTTTKSKTTTTTSVKKNGISIPNKPSSQFNPVSVEDMVFDFTVPTPIKITNPAIAQHQPIINYKDRKNIGAVTLSFNSDIVSTTTPKEKNPTIELKGAGEEFYPIKYHSETIEQRTKILKDSVDTFRDQEDVQQPQQTNDTTNISRTKFPVPLINKEDPSMVRSIGRVWMYDSETILPKRFYLLGSEQKDNLSIFSLENDIKEYSLFPGQVVMTESKKIAGSNFYYSSKLYYPLALPHFSERKESSDVNIMIASGPFDLMKSVPDYTPLDDLCSVVSEKKPHILLLLGPFIDDSNPHLPKYSETYNELFNNLMKKLSDKIPSSTKVLIIPSLKDVDHDYILPQPPYNPSINLNSNILFVPNPFTLIVNESFTIGVTSTGIYKDLKSNSHFKDNKSEPKDIFNMMINQKSFYPMHPAQAPIGMRYFQHLDFPRFTPDILIVPSQSSVPIATIASNDTLCLGVAPIIGATTFNNNNNNKLTFGSYAEITVTKSQQESFDNNIPVSKRTLVQFKNI